MTRRPRIRVPGVPQHLLQRGNNRLPTFFATADYVFYLECLREASLKHGCSIHAYVLMTHHVHLLAMPSDTDALSATMQDVGRRYVQYVNYTYRRTGTLWEGRYKAALVDTAAYFLTCSMYIELNPIRARMVSSPAEYRWSSYRFHALGEENRLLSPTRIILLWERPPSSVNLATPSSSHLESRTARWTRYATRPTGAGRSAASDSSTRSRPRSLVQHDRRSGDVPREVTRRTPRRPRATVSAEM